MAALEHIPTESELRALVGDSLCAAWTHTCEQIEALYDTDHLWNDGGKAWRYEYKYRRGGKTLCALYAREKEAGLMMIFGEAERERVEAMRGDLSAEILAAYDGAHTYRDGKWAMFPLDASLTADYVKLLTVKRKPNRKAPSPCGASCGACERFPLQCAGCSAIAGKVWWTQFTGQTACPMYACCVADKALSDCGQCADFPCAMYKQGDPTKTAEENAAILRAQIKALKGSAKR